MGVLTRHGSEVSSAFSLAGRNENDLTAALGYTLARCPALLEEVLKRVWPAALTPDADDVSLALEVRGADGRTDLEVRTPGALVIFEAKRGWRLPNPEQLGRYASRVTQHPRGGVLVTLSQASSELARASLPASIDGVPIIHLPWGSVLSSIAAVRPRCRGRERLWLDELQNYLKGVVRMRDVGDCLTYCVVLNEQKPAGGGTYTFREYVTDELCYFHPYGVRRWPTVPPNFMAFRWNGAVRRIHRVVASDVVPSLLDRWPDIPATEGTTSQHAVYQLGPRLPPPEPILNGAPYRAARLWVLLDQLQTATTLAEAYERTRALRFGDAGGDGDADDV